MSFMTARDQIEDNLTKIGDLASCPLGWQIVKDVREILDEMQTEFDDLEDREPDDFVLDSEDFDEESLRRAYRMIADGETGNAMEELHRAFRHILADPRTELRTAAAIRRAHRAEARRQ